MLNGARRLSLCALLRPIRRALLAACWLPLAQAVVAQNITSAIYADPTTRYAHCILGEATEHGELVFTLSNAKTVTITLPQSNVVQETRLRLMDVDRDGTP